MQEFDQVGIAKPVTKGAWEIPSVERIPEYRIIRIWHLELQWKAKEVQCI